MKEFEIQATVDALFGLYESYGDTEYIGEPVSVLEHSVQSAQLAHEEGYDDDVVLAALFHDIGHLLPQRPSEDMNGFGHRRHERVGAEYLLKNGFSDKIAQLVQKHVEAKRYLCWKFPEYFARLSDASRETLAFQGGVMPEREAKAFEAGPYFRLSIKMREWDEAAKETNKPIPDLQPYKEMAVSHLKRTVEAG
ncbi:MAG: HD domain-containing protein [Siphonobacter aquaeclarae]|nr:HD domain-containing protein [Siphonobacter aquaeclarae]